MNESIIKYKKGDVLFREGDTSKDLYIIQMGVVKIYKRAATKLLPIAVVHPGQFVGELSFFDGKPRSATAEAATDLRVIKLEPQDLESELKKLPGWLGVLIRSIADRVRMADDLIKRNLVVDKQVAGEFDNWEETQKIGAPDDPEDPDPKTKG